MKLLTRSVYCALGLSFLMACGVESPKIIPKAIPPDNEYSEKPQDFEAFNPQVDILFVIDNSGSMSSVQSELSQNAAVFAGAIASMPILDYHIGVVTTDMLYCGSVSSCGKLVGSPAFVQRSTLNVKDVISSKMIVGTNGSATEESFSPVIAALSPPNENQENKDFYRPNAFFAVIFITDAHDQSDVSPQQLLQFLNNKKADPSKVLGYGVIRTMATAETCGKESYETVDPDMETFLGSVANGDPAQTNILSLCSTNYGLKLAEFARDIVRRASGAVRLNRLPQVETIKVTYGTQVIPNSPTKGWTYRPATNSILLAEGIEWDYLQGPSASLRVDFEAIDITAQ